MSRIRYIKPGFFCDEDLADCSPWARLLFAGLWGIADKAGRLEDRPRRIAAAVFPYDRDVDVDACLHELCEHGPLIIRYEASGAHYIAIPGWSNHQKPHPREAESIIPEPGSHDLGSDEATPRTCSARGYGDGDGDGDGDSNGDGVNPLSDSSESDALSGTVVDDFDAFYEPYPRHEKRGKAASLWKGMSKTDREAATISSVNYARWAADHPSDPLMLPQTFLSKTGRAWEDWTHGPPPGRDRIPARSGRQVDSTFGALRQLIEEEP